ncbi:hypothetical protein V865_003515 [Kwoniella europaea PYCC6329]|uniref:AN1-type domain-containing protein n=1 Tax=Kwoniella europaea PYCC6329 TaxID=1423913 RepID=A0AAX4KJH5_9TREE
MPELIEYPCEATGCQARVLRWDAICSLCHVVCCSEHDTPDHHPCQKARTKETPELRMTAIRQIQADTERQYVSINPP